MSAIATAIVGGALIGGGATVLASQSSSDAQQQSAQTAANAQNQANQLNYQMFQESRGSKGSAVLPTYLQNPDGSLFEGKLGADLVSAYNQASTPLTTFQTATARTQEAQDNATRLTNNLFNGGVTDILQRNAAPVQAARMATARNSSLDALHKTLDQIDAAQSQRGYVGDSYANRLLSFQAGKAGGDAVGAADLQNKQESADIANYGGVTLPLQNITLPYSMAQQNGNMSFLPNDQWLQSLGQRMQPFNMVKIGYTGPFQYQPLPTPGPGAYSGTANALAAVGGMAGQAGGAALQYYQQQQLQKQLANTMYNNAAINNFNELGNPLAGYDASLAAVPGYSTPGVSSSGVDWSSAVNSGSDAFSGVALSPI